MDTSFPQMGPSGQKVQQCFSTIREEMEWNVSRNSAFHCLDTMRWKQILSWIIDEHDKLLKRSSILDEDKTYISFRSWMKKQMQNHV